VASGALYRVLTEGVNVGIWYEDTPIDWDPVFESAYTSQPGSKTWEPSKSGWAHICFVKIDTDVFSFTVMHPEQAVNAFSINGISGVINEESKTITVNVPEDTDLTNVTPVVTAASGWTCETGGAKDFTKPVEYVFSKGNVKQAYVVTVNR